jgi:predicted ArsR family transcriptional regulator
MDQNTTTWVKELLKNLDENVDEPTRKALMAACGEKCPFTHLPDQTLLEIKETSETEEVFLDSLCDRWRLEKQDGRYYIVFDQCYCPLVKDNSEGASPTLCYCTLGNIEHKFKIGLEKEVQVEMQKTILAGDEECRFYINLNP